MMILFFKILCSIEKQINLIANYAEEDDLNGTCFNKNTQTTDIKEDIKKIENLIECFRKAEIDNLECKESMYQRCKYSHYKALENILSDYKKLQKENEELKITVERKNRLLYERI